MNIMKSCKQDRSFSPIKDKIRIDSCSQTSSVILQSPLVNLLTKAFIMNQFLQTAFSIKVKHFLFIYKTIIQPAEVILDIKCHNQSEKRNQKRYPTLTGMIDISNLTSWHSEQTHYRSVPLSKVYMLIVPVTLSKDVKASAAGGSFSRSYYNQHKYQLN